MGVRDIIKRAVKPALVLCILALAVFVGIKAVSFGLLKFYMSAYPMKYTELIDAACEEKQLDRAFVYAVVRTESGFRPDVTSNVGARGLMQLMPDAYDWVAMRKGEQTDGAEVDYERLYEPELNIEYGTSMLRLLLDEFETENNALCAYHAGWGSVKQWLASEEYAPDGRNVVNIPFGDTSRYVEKVQKTADIYRRLYGI